MGSDVSSMGLSRAGATGCRVVAARAAGPVVLAAAMVLLYWPVLAGMATSWAKDENASHGFLIPPIAAYLALGRYRAARASARPWGWGMLAVTVGLVLYTLGIFASVEFLPQVSLLVVLGGICLYLWGPQTCSRLWFPLAFLWFMIPLPDTLVEFLSFPMQLSSARFATMLVGLAGMPVAREGVDIHLRDYTFSVGPACSGMKSLIALLAVAALASYLLNGPRWKRWTVFAAALPLSLLANAIRISCVLAIASTWGEKTATGFLHGFSGVVVFLLVTLGLAAAGRGLGLHFRPRTAAVADQGRSALGGSKPASEPGEDGNRSLSRRPGRAVTWRPYAVLVALLAVTQGVAAACRQAGVHDAALLTNLSQVAVRTASWQGQDSGQLDPLSQKMLRPDAYLRRIYTRRDRTPVELAVIVGHSKDTFHSPGLCLVGGGWNIRQKGRVTLGLARSTRLTANEFWLERPGERQLVLYWYASHGETTPSWVVFQYRLLRNRLTGAQTRGALVRLATPVGESEEQASRAAQELIGELDESLDKAMAL